MRSPGFLFKQAAAALEEKCGSGSPGWEAGHIGVSCLIRFQELRGHLGWKQEVLLCQGVGGTRRV